MGDTVSVEVAPCSWRMIPLAEALLMGAEKAGKKTFPSGVTEEVYRLPRSVRRQKDSGKRGIGGAKCFLTQRERASLEKYIGVPVESAQDARREMAKRGLRFAERGEAADERFDAALDAINSGTPIDGGYGPGSIDMWGDDARRKPMNGRDAFEFHRARIARGEPFRESGR